MANALNWEPFSFFTAKKGDRMMTHLNTSTLNSSHMEEKKVFHEMGEILNLPDLQFYLWCQRKYKLNKGTFNTIDSWFYGCGVGQIILRRIYLLNFLEFVKSVDLVQEHHKYLRFGHGGLKRKLRQFMEKRMDRK